MLTAKSQKNRPAAEQYFDEHLSHNDYYSQGDVRPGRWIGEGLKRLDLKEGEMVSREAFLAFCDNRHPVTDEPLTHAATGTGIAGCTTTSPARLQSRCRCLA